MPLIAIAVFAVTAFAAKAPPNPDFNANFKTAFEVGSTEEGAAYDKALAAYFFTLPEFPPALTRCVEGNTDSLRVWGYFYFDAAGGYRLVLQPENSFSKCLVAAFDAKSPPAPPKRPYLNPFTFGVDPENPSPQPPRR